MALPITRAQGIDPSAEGILRINTSLVADWLTRFLWAEVTRRRGMHQVVVGLSGGVDSAVVAFLCAKAFSSENVLAVCMPYKTSSPDSLLHAQLVVKQLGIRERTIDITNMVDGYACGFEQDISPSRLGNVCARCRMTILFDQSAKLGGLPIGTGNKSERLLGYYTWHGDDAPPINPIGDLFKTQVWDLAEHLGVPKPILEKPPTADLVRGQTDEGDIGVPYSRADRILYYLIQGYSPSKLIQLGFVKRDVELVYERLRTTHWKRRPPTTAMLSTSSIGEYYLRPVDY